MIKKYEKQYYELKIKQLEEELKISKMNEEEKIATKLKLRYENRIIPFREYMEACTTALGYHKKEEMKGFVTAENPFQEIINKIDEIIDHVNRLEDKNESRN